MSITPPSGRDLRALLRLHERGGVVTLADAQDAACLDSEAKAARWARRMVEKGALTEARNGFRVEVPRGCLPPPERKAAAGATITLGERGRWRVIKGGPLAAFGPVAEVWDGAGRRYVARWALARPGGVLMSHTAAGVKVPGFPAELQARDRGGKFSRLQVEALARELDPARWVAPSSSVVDSAPVVVPWGEVIAAASGNGRLAAFTLRALNDPAWAMQMAETAAKRWRLPAGAREALEAGAVPVRFVDVPQDMARELAGASQAIDTGAMQRQESARSKARGAGLKMQTLPGVRFFRALNNAAAVASFEATNPAFTREVLARIPSQARAAMPPEARADAYLGVMFASLPEPWPDNQRGPLDEAWWAALPALWSLHTDARDGVRTPEYDLVPHVGEAVRWAGKLRAVSAKKLGAELGQAARQVEFGEAPEAAAGAPRDLAGLLGALVLRASRRDDPAAAVGEWLEQYHAEAPDPRQVGFFAPPPPAEVLAAVVGIKRNPGPCVCDLAVRWSWGRYRTARKVQAKRLAWQPARGFKLGTLVHLTIAGQPFEVPESAGIMLCAAGEGRTDLFTVPPIVCPVPGPITAIHYVTQKGRDRAPVRYEHDTDAPHPMARARGPERALQIVTRNAAIYLDPERGLVN